MSLVEIRTYKIKPGQRERFINLFETKAVPAQAAAGMYVVGMFRATEDENAFIWIRSFASASERDRLKEAFYEGPVWKGHLEAIMMPLIEDYSDVVLCEPTTGSAIQ